MSSSDPRIYLLHIRDCGEELVQCYGLREQGSVPVSILFNAVCRNLEIIGEASRKVGADFRAAHPAIPWREMNDLRNVLIHEYEGPIRTWSGLLWNGTSHGYSQRFATFSRWRASNPTPSSRKHHDRRNFLSCRLESFDLACVPPLANGLSRPSTSVL